jgi:CHAT domain-containing protein/tetratricopeptide (TPR) repeat protein
MSSYLYPVRLVLAIFALASAGIDPAVFVYGQSQPSIPPAETKATLRKLVGNDAKQVAELEKNIDERRRARKFGEAIEPAKEVLAICERALGKEHWKAREASGVVATLMHIAGLSEEGRKAMASVGNLEDKRATARKNNRYDEAERLSQDLLAIHRRWLGEVHTETARDYGHLAYYLVRKGKFAEAEALDRKALAIQVETLGEIHPETASTCHNLAFNLNEQGKHAEAEPIHRRALRIHLQTVGEDHPETAIVYNIFGRNLQSQGNFARAEPMFRRALAIRLKVLPAVHPSTATSFYNLGLVLLEQGKFAESEPMCREALALRLKIYSENHFLTANSYDALAADLDYQGKTAEAESLYRNALAIKRKVLGDDNTRTANSYDNLACALTRHGKHAEADPLYHKALAIMLKAGGQNDQLTANIYDNLANHLGYQGKHAEAEPLHRQAMEISLKTLGKFHVDTAARSRNLAFSLDAQGKLDEAVQYWTTAAQIYETVRQWYSSVGLERSLTADGSPLSALAVALARQGKPREAWTRYETGLARGLLDDLSARRLRPLTVDQQCREADLAGQSQSLDERISRLAANLKRTLNEDKQLDAWRNQQSVLRGRWVELQNELDRDYQAYAGKPSSLEDVQRALRADTALVGWLDVRNHHWACVVRHEGNPAWVRIAGSGKDGAWTEEDNEKPARLRHVLADNKSGWENEAAGLARQRLTPLLPYLIGAKRVLVLPSPALAGVPIEALAAASRAHDPTLVFSYTPSGSMYAHLSAPQTRGAKLRLLAIGDPTFAEPAALGPAPIPPDHGISVVDVVPQSAADLFGIKPGDVLLEYNGKQLRTIKDLVIVPAGDKSVRVPIKLWRDGEVRALEIAAGRLGIESNPNLTAAQVILAHREATAILASGVRDASLTPLPGSRREVQDIAALFPQDQVTTLLGKDSTESNLQKLAASGALRSYRFIHLATHGKANPSVALSSALFLAAESKREPPLFADPSAVEDVPDGQITAQQIVNTWDLDADMVVLSACETGLGRYAGGEGYLGFTQALFVKGARSVVLSLWKVDDRATSLLMKRFYQNLLGKREDGKAPMLKAEALSEAKAWLRIQSAEDDSTSRGEPRKSLKVSEPRKSRRAPGPFDSPYYWAGFILVGDPN